MTIIILLGILLPESFFLLIKHQSHWNNLSELFIAFGKYYVNDVLYAKDFECVLILRTWALVPIIALDKPSLVGRLPNV